MLIAAEDLDRTGLVRPGSRVRHRTLIMLPEGRDPEAFKVKLAAAVPDTAVRITTYAQAQPGLRRFWDQLTMYLGLTGLVALMVGGIGVAVSVRAFVRQKLGTIAVLKCLGASSRQVLAIYLLQTTLLGLGGSLLGAVLGSALQPLLTPFLVRLLPIALDGGISPLAILRGLAMGVGVTLLFALWPLLEIRRGSARADPEARRRAAILRGRRPWLGLRPHRGRPRRARALAGGLVEGRRALPRRAGRRAPGARPRRAARRRAGSGAAGGARSPGGKARPISTARAATRPPCSCRSASP